MLRLAPMEVKAAYGAETQNREQLGAADSFSLSQSAAGTVPEATAGKPPPPIVTLAETGYFALDDLAMLAMVRSLYPPSTLTESLFFSPTGMLSSIGSA